MKDRAGPVARQALLERFFEDSTDAIVVTDVEGRILDANPAWCRLYGYALDEVLGRTTRLIKSGQTTPEMYKYMWEQIRDPSKGSWKGEIINRRRDGAEVPVLLTITPIRGSGGAIEGYTGLTIDISERKQIEQMKDLYDLVVQHDLRAPIGSLIALSQTMLEGFLGPLEPRHRDLIERIHRLGLRLREIVQTSLDMDGLRRGELRLDWSDVDLVAVGRESIELLRPQAAAKDVRVDLFRGDRPATGEDRRTLRLDAVHVQRAADNLVKNAIEASPPGGRVRVTVAEGGEGGSVLFRVENGGPPIPADVRAILFHPFGTFGKRGGSGLGLYGVKMAVEAMGGRIDYETGEAGTRFEIRFPPPPGPARAG